MMNLLNIGLTEFAERHWKKDFTGTRITSHDPEKFVGYLISALMLPALECASIKIEDGYADFCKLIIVPNFTDAKTGTLPITLENYRYLRTGYFSRVEDELPVLSRWFDLPLPAPRAKYLVIVVYSRDQLLKEELENNSKSFCFNEDNFLKDIDWGIVAILGQMEQKEEPMKPATMIRNALGIKEGGSGVPINREKYFESVEFWKNHATVKS